MSFDAFGARRKTNWAGELTQAETEALLSDVGIGIGTSRGYTGHEHLDRTGLIHMNGRVYDPTLGRFLSADPIVQAPYFSQSYNRYTYVWNNPLGMNDPSGYEGNDSLGEDDKEAPEPEPEKKREKPKPGVHRLHAGNGYSIVYGDGSSDDGESEGARSDQEESEEPEEGELTTELIRGDSNNGEILEEGVLGQEGAQKGREQLSGSKEQADTSQLDGSLLAMSKGGKQNISVGGHNRNSNPVDVQNAMNEAKDAGNQSHYRKLKGLLKVIKRGGRMIGPVIPITPENLQRMLHQPGVQIEFDLKTQDGLDACYEANLCA